MDADWKIKDLIDLIRRRYPDWSGFDHPDFVKDEIAYKQAAVAKAGEWLNQAELNRLIAEADYETFLERLDKLGRDTNLLWRRVPSSADTAILYHPNLDRPAFCAQMRNLLYGDLPSPERLQTFADYAAGEELPNRWPFPTYFLFICHPETEMFVRPRPMEWILKYLGQTVSVIAPPSSELYATILASAHTLLDELRPYGAEDMVDVQSFIWVCAREGREVTGRLDTRGQVELDVPATSTDEPPVYGIASNLELLREAGEEWVADEEAKEEMGNGSTMTENPPYTLEAWSQESGEDPAELSRWVRAVERKGQIIFYGPPGTGKTFMAEEMARYLVSGVDGRQLDGFVELVQFHPAYAYEDFIQGIRPVSQVDGTLRYELTPGRFYQFCRRAQMHQGTCVFIIDEINRADIAGVFGELMYLLEYRDRTIPLSGGGSFSIPANVRLIGTMNTADRSIALVDHALRRRFAFIPLRPNFDMLRRYHARIGSDEHFIDALITVLHRLNNQIGDPHYHIGHTFFMQPKLESELEDIWRMEIEPYLEEYFFDRPDSMEGVSWQQIQKQLS